jgi:hypothetical protein
LSPAQWTTAEIGWSWNVRRTAATSRTSAFQVRNDAAREFAQPGDHGAIAVRKIVEHDRRVARPRERDDDVRPDITGAAGHEDCSCHPAMLP